jgi:hypothetical protein
VDELQARRGYALGAVDYIPSPVVPEVLRSKVRVFVELFRMNRQLQKQATQREQLARSEAGRAAAEEAIHRADFLAQASQVLSRSLHLDDTIAAVLDQCIPMLGERAILGIPDSDGGVCRLDMHPAPARDEREVSPELRGGRPGDPHSSSTCGGHEGRARDLPADGGRRDPRRRVLWAGTVRRHAASL